MQAKPFVLAVVLVAGCSFPVRAEYTVVVLPEMKAQRACGIVVDSTEAAIPEASVEEVKSQKKVTTDKEGRFAFSNRKRLYLRIKKMGFDDVEVPVRIDKKAKPCLTITLPVAS